MTRSARRRRDRVTVDQLLRETGATPRKLESGPLSADRRPRDLFGRERVERRVEVATGPRRIGSRARRRALLSGAGMLAGGLVLLVLASGRTAADQPALPFVPLPPATGPLPTADAGTTAPVSSATPSPVVMSATRTKPKVVIPAAPVVTTTLPKPVTPTPTPGYPYGGYCPSYPYCGYYHH